METRVAKELLHIQHWLEIAASIVTKGKTAYAADEVAQEAGDSLMIKIGEAAKTLSDRGLEAPAGVSWSDAAKNREKLAHHYSITDRDVTWQTLSVSLPMMPRRQDDEPSERRERDQKRHQEPLRETRISTYDAVLSGRPVHMKP